MRQGFVFLLAILPCIIHFSNGQELPKNVSVNDVVSYTHNAVNFAANMFGIVTEEGTTDTEKVLRMVKVVAEVIGRLHPAGMLISQAIGVVVPPQDPLAKFMKEFQKLQDHLNQLDDKLSHLSELIKQESSFSQYETTVLLPKVFIQAAAKAHANVLSNNTLKAYRKACGNPDQSPIGVISWIGNLVTSDNLGGTLFDAIYSNADLDRRRFRQHATGVLRDVFEWGVIASLCTGLQRDGNNEREVEYYASEVQRVFGEVITKMIEYDNKLLHAFPEQAFGELMAKVSTPYKQSMVDAALKHLSERYYWNEFYVEVSRAKKNSLLYDRFYKKKEWNADYCFSERKEMSRNCSVVQKGTGALLSGYRSYVDKDKSILMVWADKSRVDQRVVWEAAISLDQDLELCLNSEQPQAEFLKDLIVQDSDVSHMMPKWLYVVAPGDHAKGRSNSTAFYAGTQICTYSKVFGSDEEVQYDVIVGF